ncbi:MAG TPA: adenylate/guanylate cyclase domain-containing protein, partial [Acidimicrobiales bacterium]|nr:adenylate/guanylate cyclase domain-containing protein [Acidimicrobiales bacterium]
MTDAPGPPPGLPHLDPAAVGDGGIGAVRDMLAGLGCTVEELDRAERDGTLPLLAVERLIVPEVALYDLDAVTARTGIAAGHIRQLWRSLGYPEPRPGEVVFTEVDRELLGEVGRLMEGELITDLVLHISRVIGSSMARVASSQVDVISTRAPGAPRHAVVGDVEVSDDVLVSGAAALLPLVPRVLDAAWRRHLRVAIRRRLSIAEAGQGQLGVVGFADLVGFTALSQQVGDDELAAIVDRFERLAFDAVTAEGGRVVKMIGDEVMFTVDEPRAAAEIALALAEGTRGADDLSELRVGLAYGPLLEREGDLYGPMVNLASRITAVAFPGTIVVSASIHDALVHDPDYRLRSMRPRNLKDIGRVSLSVLRRAAPGESRFADRRPALRDAVTAGVEPADDRRRRS